MKTLWQVRYWLEESSVRGLDYVDYWNNEEVEREKEMDISDGDFGKMEAYLERSGLIRDLEGCVSWIRNHLGRNLEGTGADLAAGNLWSVPHLLRLGRVDRLYGLDFSRHRLLKLAPAVLQHYGVPPEKVILVYGSFYEIRLPAASLDFVLLSAAFHHARYPDRLLAEIRRVLKPGGLVLIIGEHKIPEPWTWGYVRACARYLAGGLLSWFPERIQRRFFGRTFRRRALIPRHQRIFAPDPVTGDHYYTLSQYQKMFREQAFSFQLLSPPGAQYRSFVLVKETGNSRRTP